MDALLRLIEENALRTPETMAKMLGRSVEEVARQIKAFEDDKVILAYKAVIDDNKVDHHFVRAVIEVRITPERGGGFDRLAERIARFPEVTSCFLISGSYDLLVFVEGENLREVASFVSQKLSTIQGVLSTATHFILKPYKIQGTLLAEAAATEARLQVSP